MRATFIVTLLFLTVGCSQQQTLEERANRNESDLKKLVNSAKTVRSDLVKSRESCVDSIARSQAEIFKCDEMLAKLDQLLGVRPNPNPPNPVPTPNPSPVPPGPKPDVLPPVPNPAPIPVGPVDGKFGVANAVWKIANGVESPDRDAECKALADVFASVAKDVRDKKLDGTLLDPQWHRISVALTAGNKPIIARHFTAWDNPATQMSKKIVQFYKEGKLNSNEDWADLLDEIALGLKFGRK